ncbi:hypothetical protein K2173_021892 [Erythroxylum novogranatense]|uniref:Uncharacterized protein n=1 Tax=Erythroxylum novogranatense TaxID=1862640 RepID=A0AAV8T3F4_9ROSI|nr:hypothetical protein K2173_021892 [Erythroxylum novogranatense]
MLRLDDAYVVRSREIGGGHFSLSLSLFHANQFVSCRPLRFPFLVLALHPIAPLLHCPTSLPPRHSLFLLLPHPTTKVFQCDEFDSNKSKGL